MTGQTRAPELEWRPGDIPVATRFGDPYYSLHDGLAETRHVFLQGNGLPERFRPGFHIAELGFGTGLNLLAAWAAWEQAGQTGPLRFTSFEAYPLPREDMARALARFPAISDHAARFLVDFDGAQARLETLEFDLVVGDARETLPNWDGRADAWFLDGFAPARNPQMWEPALLAEVARHSAAGATASTYTAAGHVRRALAAAGFEVSRAPGFGSKRHMTVARLP